MRTARLLLRAMTEADVDDIHSYQSRADVCRYLSFEPRTRDQVADKVALYSAALALNGDGDFWQLAVERAQDPGRVIGDVYFCVNEHGQRIGGDRLDVAPRPCRQRLHDRGGGRGAPDRI